LPYLQGRANALPEGGGGEAIGVEDVGGHHGQADDVVAAFFDANIEDPLTAEKAEV
jgi:hypothetical protein